MVLNIWRCHNQEVNRINLKKLHPLRLSEQDYNKLNNDSVNAGLTLSDYLRKLINQQEVKPKPPDSYSNLAWEISKIGTNINQLAHKANAAGQASENDVETAVFLLKQIYKLMREMR